MTPMAETGITRPPPALSSRLPCHTSLVASCGHGRRDPLCPRLVVDQVAQRALGAHRPAGPRAAPRVAAFT